MVLALFVCAASAATFPQRTWQNPQNFAKATAQVSVPVETAREVVIGNTKTFGQQPVVQSFAKAVVTPLQPIARGPWQPVATPTKVTGQGFKSVKVEDTDAHATVLRSENAVLPDGFNYAYETSNGIAAASTGTLKKVEDGETLTVRGQYQYISPEGVPIQLTYVADEYGYQPNSDILPVGPPVPIAIARSLEYIAAHPPKTLKTN